MPALGPGNRPVPRQFEPSMDARFSHMYALSEAAQREHPGLTWYNENKEVTHLRRTFLTSATTWDVAIEPGSIVVEIGWEPIVDREERRLSNDQRVWGVSFGPESSWNEFGPTYEALPPFNLTAVFQALHEGCTKIEECLKAEKSIREVIIMTSEPCLLDMYAWGEDHGDINRLWSDWDAEPLPRKIELCLRRIEAKCSVAFWLTTAYTGGVRRYIETMWDCDTTVYDE